MFIESIQLKNYRNYESLSVAFDHGTNVFYGDNAQGKTNLLESIFLCGTAKSHRGTKDMDLIRFGAEEAHIRMFVSRSGIKRRIDMHLRKGKAKGAAIDGIPIRRAAELLKLCSFVFFSPEDLNMIKNGPKERRSFLDALISQTDPFYLHTLTSYQKVVAQRNKLLKELYYKPSLESTLEAWDEQLVRYGASLINARKKMLMQLNEIVIPIHLKLTGALERIAIIYEPNVEAEIFADKLKSARERDKRQAMSTVGPHRDDFKITVQDVDLRQFGSQGQQRSAALSLKLAEISLIRELIGEEPILLLDDVLSELDSNRQKDLLESIGHVQTFITCTGMDSLLGHQFPIDRIFHVKHGEIIK